MTEISLSELLSADVFIQPYSWYSHFSGFYVNSNKFPTNNYAKNNHDIKLHLHKNLIIKLCLDTYIILRSKIVFIGGFFRWEVIKEEEKTRFY